MGLGSESNVLLVAGAIVAAIPFACTRERSPDARPTTTSAAPPPAAAHGPTRDVVVEVTHYLAVGWAESPTVRVEGSPPDTTATLYIPAGRSRDAALDSCWRDRPVAVGDRYRLTVQLDERDAGPGGPYRLRIAIHESGTNASWDLLGCERLADVQRDAR